MAYIQKLTATTVGRSGEKVARMNISLDLPRSAIIVLDRLTHDGPLTPKALSQKVDLAPRTVSFALRRLMGQNLCRKIPNLHDMRQPLYMADLERAKELRMKYEHVFRQVLM
jgi:DNA-binding MarR family transcriptional regulator